MKNFRFLSLWVLVITLVPLVSFLVFSLSIQKKSLKNTVVNDPQAALAQALSGLNGSYSQTANQALLAALHLSIMDSFQKAYLAPPGASLSVSSVGQSEAKANPLFSLWIVTNKAGKVLYDNLGIPKPPPSPLPSVSSNKNKRAKTKQPLYADIHDWPGMERVLGGTTSLSGILAYQGTSYLTSAVAVLNHSKTVGAVLTGIKIDKNFLKNLKAASPGEIAIYSQGETFYTGSVSLPPIPPQSTPVTIQSGQSSYLAGSLPLPGLDGKTVMSRLVVFQPIKQSLTVEGTPQKSLLKTGLLLLLITVLCTLGLLWQYMAPFNRLLVAVDQITKGNLHVSLPLGRPDELGRMARSLEEMIESMQERDRISLVLGKVVDPQAAKKILGDKGYFALKGERRECTLLQADLKGFNTLSENMDPETLVEALNRYFSIINEVVFKYEGMLDKFIGDTAVAVWGAPFSHEDKEARAVKTALEIQEALKEFNISRIKTGHPPFTMGIGIHTGMVVSGNLGSDKRFDYSIIGEPLHVVSRLCVMAAPGQTVVSEETYEKIKTLVKTKPLNPIAVKDSLEPLKTFEIAQMV